MSIYFYITRNAEPLMTENNDPISKEEFKKAIATMPELAMEQPSDSEPYTTCAVWDSYPGGYPAWFCVLDGEIEIKGMDEFLYSKSTRLASLLGAKIFREDGEEFTHRRPDQEF